MIGVQAVDGSSPAGSMGEIARVVRLEAPFLLFIGDVTDADDAKTGFGLRDWRQKDCIGQLRLPGCLVDLGLPNLSPGAAAARGARTLVIGVAPMGGQLSETWRSALVEALEAGLSLASGLHQRLADDPQLQAAAQRSGGEIIDLRDGGRFRAVGTGQRRTGKRLLTVGTDCALGKKYAALALARELGRRGVPHDFRATGQTGIMISGGGVPIDAVVADFIAGAAECLSPSAANDHWDIIEGQGALLHPAYAGVSLGLLHGSQPDAFVVCDEPTRRTLSGMPGFEIPSAETIVALTIELGKVTNPAIRCVGASLNLAKVDTADRRDLLQSYERRLGVPAFDPMGAGVERVVDALMAF